MKLQKTSTDPYFSEKSRTLGNAYIVQTEHNLFHYEFIVQGTSATLFCDSLEYLEEVILQHHKQNPFITYYHTKGNEFYMNFDSTPTFKLPISILQVSTLFLNQTYLDTLKTYISLDKVYIPVQIIDDEYVVLGRHHALYLAYVEEEKMVNVYLSEPNQYTKEYLYLAKEQNIKHIQDVQRLPQDLYQSITEQFHLLFEKNGDTF